MRGKLIATLDTTLDFALHLPPSNSAGGLDQDEEWCEITTDGQRRRIRLHDYAEIFTIPGLYERIFQESLECDSPRVVCDLLAQQLDDDGIDPADLTALDFGAGNGMVGEVLDDLGVGSLVGVDLLEEAKEAAYRDRPDLYEDYHSLDLTALTDENRSDLAEHDFDLVSCVAALGFGDIPAVAFAEALNFVADGGWTAFNVRDRFFEEDDPTGFGGFLRRCFREGVLEKRAQVGYTHRVSVDGEPLRYLAVVANKAGDVPMEWATAA
ncbi:MAG: methyltransferase domain-containing protein [Solirubrobacteraceae bacterium]